MNLIELSVPGISCDHCVNAIKGEVGEVSGVTNVDVDLATKIVRITGAADLGAIRAAISEAGYEAA